MEIKGNELKCSRLDTLLSSKNLDQYLREAIHYLVPLLELTDSVGDDLSDHGAWGFADILQPEGDNTLKWKAETKGYKTIFDFLSVRIYIYILKLHLYKFKVY